MRDVRFRLMFDWCTTDSFKEGIIEQNRRFKRVKRVDDWNYKSSPSRRTLAGTVMTVRVSERCRLKNVKHDGWSYQRISIILQCQHFNDEGYSKPLILN